VPKIQRRDNQKSGITGPSHSNEILKGRTETKGKPPGEDRKQQGRGRIFDWGEDNETLNKTHLIGVRERKEPWKSRLGERRKAR